MSKVKAELLKQIEKRAQDIKGRQLKAATVKTVESICFEFFEKVDEAKSVGATYGEEIDVKVLSEAIRDLESRISSTFDYKAKVKIQYETDADGWGTYNLRGVTVFWSLNYIKKNKVEPSVFIDINQMLFV